MLNKHKSGIISSEMIYLRRLEGTTRGGRIINTIIGECFENALCSRRGRSKKLKKVLLI